MNTLAPKSSQALNVLLVEDETVVGGAIQALLRRLGHHVIGQAENERQALQMFEQGKPDLVLMDIKLKHDDGIQVVESLLAEKPVPVVVLSAYSDPEYVTRAAAVGVFGYLLKPASLHSLSAAITIAMSRFCEQHQLQQQHDELARTLASRKLVDRAKSILMNRLKLSESDAHRRLQLESQKRRVTIGDIAQRVIDSEDMFQ